MTSEFDLSISPALEALKDLVSGFQDTLSKVAALVESRADAAFSPLAEASEKSLAGIDASSGGARSALSGVAGSADRAAAALHGAGGAGVHAAAGIAAAGHGAAAGASGFAGFGASALKVLHVAGTVGHGIAGLREIVKTSRGGWDAASASIRGHIVTLAKVAAVATAAGAAVWGVSRAWKAWGATAAPKVPSAPKMGGMGAGAGNGGFTQGLSGAGGELANAAYMITGLFSRLGPMIAAGLAAAGLAGVVGKAAAAGKEDETRRVKFEAVVGDTGKVKTALAELEKLSIAAPGQEMGALVNETKRLVMQGHGIESVTAALALVAPAALVTEESISGLASSFLSMKEAGTVSVADLSGLMGKGVPIVNALAKSLGLPRDAVLAMAEAGNLTFPQLQAGWESMNAAGGRFHGAMAKQGATTAGTMERIGKEMHGVFSELGKPINDLIGARLQGNAAWAEKLHAWARRAGEALAGAAESAIVLYEGLGDTELMGLAGGALVSVFKSASNELYAGMVGAASAFGVVFGAVIEAGMNTLGHMDFLSGLGKAMMGALDKTVGVGIKNMMASLFEGIEASTGMGGATARQYRDDAKQLNARADQNMDLGTALMKPYAGELEKVKTAIARAGEAYATAADGAKKPFTVDPAAIGNLAAAVAARRASVESARAEIQAPIVKKGLEKESGASSSVAAAGGIFSQAVNLLMGRNVNEMILSEHQDTNRNLEETNRKLDQVNKNLSRRPLDLVPRFA